MIINKFAKPVAWCLLGGIIFVTVSPIGLRPHTITTVNIDRALAYLLVGLVFAVAYPKQWMRIALLLIVGAVAIEYMQYLSPTRHARLHDAAIKAVGASFGVMAGCLFNRFRPDVAEGRTSSSMVTSDALD
ncbi:antibiotic resistance protein VanZ [Rhizobium sp. Root708]|uniref:antibiotic resistance protein VanZ n=1 Tax=Rhizobium sp. Root708 TaxID=1736592 RepID=UPI000700E9BA|nr:antibiotic resistance protein VanZ [Rhizobium sp. Root708]KRB53134.1 antibiotic resistance protein VanZ [Rhizobium sp. Root708]